jgi:hypothetical protein
MTASSDAVQVGGGCDSWTWRVWFIVEELGACLGRRR